MKSKFSFGFLIGIMAGFFYLLNILLISAITFLLSPLGKLFPNRKIQKHCTFLIHHIIALWAYVNHMILGLTVNTRIDVQGTEALSIHDWYLVTANHQSWADICVLYEVFNHKIPVLRFLAQQELLWFPFVSQSHCFFKKSGKKKKSDPMGSALEKEDQKNRSCQKFKTGPTAIVTFIEGVRYSQEKAKKQQSPYQHLLKPRAGEIAIVLSELKDYIHQYLDVTIVYPDGRCSLWDFFCGRVKRIIVKVTIRAVTEEFIGDFQADESFRERFQRLVDQIWSEKDQLIQETLKSEIN